MGPPLVPFRCIVHRDKAEGTSPTCGKLKEVIPRQQYQVAIQAGHRRQVVAQNSPCVAQGRDRRKCCRVTSPKLALLESKEGKKRMKTFGTVQIPRAFIEVLKKPDL